MQVPWKRGWYRLVFPDYEGTGWSSWSTRKSLMFTLKLWYHIQIQSVQKGIGKMVNIDTYDVKCVDICE